MTQLLGIDIADRMGIAYTDLDGNIYTDVLYYEKTDTYLSAKYQIELLTQFPLTTKILIEDFNYFDSNRNRGKITLIKRFGYIEYTLRSLGYEVELLHINENRKEYCVDKPKQKRVQKTNKKGELKYKKDGSIQYCLDGISSKEWIHNKVCQYSQLSLTTDHTDAILLIMSKLNLSYDDIRDKIILV